MNKLINIDINNSRRACFHNCQQKYYWKYVREIIPKTGSNALRYGLTWHGFTEGYRKGKIAGLSEAECRKLAAKTGIAKWQEDLQSGQSFYEDYRNFERCLKTFDLYLNQPFLSNITYIQVELEFRYPIIAFPLLGYQVFFTGRIDALVKIGETFAVLDDKTTSLPLYQTIDSMSVSNQTLGYAYIARFFLPQKIDTVYINIVQTSGRKKKDDTYGEISNDFALVPFNYTDYRIHQWLNSYADTAEQICKATESNKFTFQFDSCKDMWGKCPYYDLCLLEPHIAEEVVQSNFIKLKKKEEMV